MSKTMDSVFADCVDDELEFDILFEDIEDHLVDIVAGCNEAGVLFTEDFEGLTEAQLLEAEEIDDVEPEPETAEDESCKKEAADVSEPAEEVKAEDEGCKKEAAEVCPNCGKAPCECGDPITAAQADTGAQDPAPAQPLDAATAAEDEGCCKKEAADVTETQEVDVTLEEDVDALLALLDEEAEADPIEDKCDCAERQGEVKHDTDNVEGVSTETPADAMEKDSKEADPIEDADDTAEREGEVKHDEVEMDGVNQPVVGAAAATNANGDVEDAQIEEDVDALLNKVEKDAEADPVCDADDTAEREAEVKHDDKDLEGTKDVDPEIGGEVGDGKEVSGKENSAESQAHDVTKDIDSAIGADDKQQVKLEDAAEGPLEDDDPAEREGKTSDADGADPALADDAYSETVDALLAALDEEAEDPIQDADDTAEREGEVKHDTNQEEGIKQDVIDAANDGKANEDPIQDADDTAEREGEVKHDESDKEGVNQPTVAAALEDADFVDDLLAALSDDIDIQAVEPVVPDDVKTNGTSSVDEASEEPKADDVVEDLDDEDIQAIEADDDKGDVELDYEEGDDDDLIAAIDQGIDVE